MTAADAGQRALHWQKTRNLMIAHMIVWFVFSFVVHWFAPTLNTMRFLEFPLGYYMAAQGSLLAFVIQLFIFVWQQDQIDRRFGVAEDD